MDKALTIRVRRGPGHTILAAAGEIDIATVARSAPGCSRWPVKAAR